MKIKQFINRDYDNWIRYNDQSLNDDFNEYKKKETSKWKDRAKMIDARFPVFNNIEEFKKALDKAKIVNTYTLNDVNNLTSNNNIQNIKHMVAGYLVPRDVDRIVDGFSKNVKMPLPIILKGKNGFWIMAGNTRSNVANVLGITAKSLLVDVSK